MPVNIRKKSTPSINFSFSFSSDYRNQHSRDFSEDIGDVETIQQELEFSAVPHFTTIQKFSRLKPLFLHYAFGKTLNLFYSDDDPIPITAIDSSGFTSTYFSHYYSDRNRQDSKAFPENFDLG